MALVATFEFDRTYAILHVGFLPNGKLASREDVESLIATIEQRSRDLGVKPHLFFDLTHLTVPQDLVEHFTTRKRSVCDEWALSCWHYGGNLAERVMTRNDYSQRGIRSNLYKSREEAMDAFRKSPRSGCR